MPRLLTKLQRLGYPVAFTQTRTAFALKIATLIAATVTIFYGDLALIFNDAWQNETAIYILVVPFIVAYLIYRKRKMLRAVMPLSGNHQPRNAQSLASLTGILLAATAILLYWQGSYAFTPLESHIYVFTPVASHIFTLPILVIGLILILFNSQTLRQLALPIAFLFFLVPPPSSILARALLGSFILIFTITIILLSISDKASRTHILHKTSLKCNQCNLDPPPNRDYCRACGRIFHPGNAKLHKTDTAKIATIILVAILLVTIQSPVFAINKRTPMITIKTPSGLQYSTQLLPETNQYSLTWRGEDQPLEVKASKRHQDLVAIEYTYTPFPNESLYQVYLGLEISSAQASLPPISPLTRTIQLAQASIQINNNYYSPIQAQYFVNESTDVDTNIVAVLYWYSPTVFIINQTAQLKQVQTQLTIVNVRKDELPEVEQQLVDLATQINNYWLPSETYPEEVARSLSQNGISLSAATSIAVAATLVYYAAENKRRRKATMAAVSKLNSLNMEIVKALQTTKPATVGNLAATLQKNTGQTITPEELEQRLRELENVGIIKSQISSQNDIPIQTWKA
jgi:DNA-binding HxlR family transcriptional regulator